MRNPSSLKKEFLKKWIKGLQICSATKKNMSTIERKKAIKLSADIAIASTRKSTTYWSHALIMSNASKDEKNKIIIENILENNNIFKKNKTSMGKISISQKGIIIRSKKIVKKSCKISRIRARKMMMISPSIIAKKMVKKRTQVLKSLVPGGEYMDDASLIKETLDYIISLRVQVDVMRHLANYEINNPKKNNL